MAEIKKLLDDAIETEINNLNSASDKDEKSEVIKNLAALHKLRIWAGLTAPTPMECILSTSSR